MTRLTPQQLAQFDALGYLGFPGLLADRAAAIIDEFEAVWVKHGGGHDGKPHDEKARSVVVQFLDQSEYLSTLLDDPRILDIAASILGYIRQAALGEPLLPFEQRVANAMQHIYAKKPWTPVQRKWLDRLAKQLALEVVIDPSFVNRAFAQDGGAKQLDKVIGGELDLVMTELAANLWPKSA